MADAMVRRSEEQAEHVEDYDCQRCAGGDCNQPGDHDIPDRVQVDGAYAARQTNTKHGADQGVCGGDRQTQF